MQPAYKESIVACTYYLTIYYRALAQIHREARLALLLDKYSY